MSFNFTPYYKSFLNNAKILGAKPNTNVGGKIVKKISHIDRHTFDIFFLIQLYISLKCEIKSKSCRNQTHTQKKPASSKK